MSIALVGCGVQSSNWDKGATTTLNRRTYQGQVKMKNEVVLLRTADGQLFEMPIHCLIQGYSTAKGMYERLSMDYFSDGLPYDRWCKLENDGILKLYQGLRLMDRNFQEPWLREVDGTVANWEKRRLPELPDWKGGWYLFDLEQDHIYYMTTQNAHQVARLVLKDDYPELLPMVDNYRLMSNADIPKFIATLERSLNRDIP